LSPSAPASSTPPMRNSADSGRNHRKTAALAASEERYRKLNAELENRVADRTANCRSRTQI